MEGSTSKSETKEDALVEAQVSELDQVQHARTAVPESLFENQPSTKFIRSLLSAQPWCHIDEHDPEPIKVRDNPAIPSISSIACLTADSACAVLRRHLCSRKQVV